LTAITTFLERAVAGTLAEAVDRALDLPRAADLDAGERVGDRHAEVVVAMHRPDRLVGIRDLATQIGQELTVELGDGVADRVGDVDRRRALGDDGLEDAVEELRIGAIAVLGRELDVAAEVARKPRRQPRLLEDLLARHAELFLHVQIARRQEDVDARRLAALQRLGGARDVAVVGARERADRRGADRLRDRLHRFEVAVRRRREAGLDDVDLEPLELAGDAELFVLGHRGAGRLLAVAQGRVEDDQAVGHGGLPVRAKTKRPAAFASGPLTRREYERSASP
jgi:hypothetical protein